jgi:hypothetical protein
MKKGKVGTSGREISAALYPKGRPETEEYKERLAVFERNQERRQRINRKPQGIEAKRDRWNKRTT